MANFAMPLLMILMALVAFVGTPGGIIWGWLAWRKESSRSEFSARMSFVGFLMANASVCVGLVGVVYAGVIGGFPYYDLRLMRFIAVGSLLALAGLLVSFIGCWRPSVPRWIAPLSAAGASFFWIIAATGE